MTHQEIDLVEFLVKARAAPVDADNFRQARGRGQGVEYLADILRAGLFVSQGHRSDTVVSLVLEKSRDYSRILRFSGKDLGSLPGLHEPQLLAVIAEALAAGAGLAKNARVTGPRGVEVLAVSFEHYVKEKCAQAQSDAIDSYLLDPAGEDIRQVAISPEAIILLTDHTPMPKKTRHALAKLGVRKLSVGPVALHAAQCITLVHNELDRRSAKR